jgi:hypothetical protein
MQAPSLQQTKPHSSLADESVSRSECSSDLDRHSPELTVDRDTKMPVQLGRVARRLDEPLLARKTTIGVTPMVSD